MISVCLSTYNGARFIQEQVESILKQLNEEDELIISDDGSSDNTLEIIHSFQDKRIKVVPHEKDKRFHNYSFYSITRNFENALRHSRGDIVFLSDQDDVWENNKVAIVTEAIKDNLVVLHDCKIVDAEGKTLTDSYFKINKSKQGFFRNLVNSSYLGCCMAIKKELLQKALPFPVNPIPQDIWLGLLAEWKHKVIFLDDKLILYRRHDSNMSTSGSHSSFSLRMKLTYRLILFYELLKNILKLKR